MNVEVTQAALSEKSILRNLIELYLYDFSEFQPRDLDAHGLFGYRYLDNYWTEPERLPFLIRVDGELAGFVLIRKRDDLSSVSEFFVVRRYRRVGVGRAAVTALVEQLRGHWEVQVLPENAGGLAFWREALRPWKPSNETLADGIVVYRFKAS